MIKVTMSPTNSGPQRGQNRNPKANLKKTPTQMLTIMLKSVIFVLSEEYR